MELGVILIDFVVPRAEGDHGPVLQEVVILRRVRVQPLVLEIVDPMETDASVLNFHQPLTSILYKQEHSLFIANLDLEAYDITVLDLTLRERQLGLHELDHARFNFLSRRSRL